MVIRFCKAGGGAHGLDIGVSQLQNCELLGAAVPVLQRTMTVTRQAGLGVPVDRGDHVGDYEQLRRARL